MNIFQTTKHLMVFAIIVYLGYAAVIGFLSTRASAQEPIVDLEFDYAEAIAPNGEVVHQFVAPEPETIFFYIGADSLAILKDPAGPNYLKMVKQTTFDHVGDVPVTVYELIDREDSRKGLMVAHIVKDDAYGPNETISFISKAQTLVICYERIPTNEVIR